ncbi:site-specific DNA-methyltransferase [Candidatus Sumerlaeota bacterium]|nr:site-specific DNA-methyltransferase [Candidatus Sumerlaeota bacterium]
MPYQPNEDNDIETLLLRKKQAEHEAFLKHYTRRSGLLLDKRTAVLQSDALDWLHGLPDTSIHAVVTDPPRDPAEIDILVGEASARAEGVRHWNISASLDTLDAEPTARLPEPEESLAYRNIRIVYTALGLELMRVLVPGAHVFVGSDPILSTPIFAALVRSGLEKRGEIVRTYDRGEGGQAPRDARNEFPDVSELPRTLWEPWGIFMKPVERSVSENLRKWSTGALRNLPYGLPVGQPLSDVIPSAPTPREELEIAPYPALKPQAFLRRIVWTTLPLGLGIVVDPFAGGGATVAAAAALGYMSVGVERRSDNFAICCNAFARLKEIHIETI